MALTGYIKNLFADKEKTIPLFPRTKVKAVSDDNGVGLNVIIDELQNEVIPMSRGGTEATDGATGLKNLFAAGSTVLSSYQYGATKPANPEVGQLFFEEATGTIADIGQDMAKALRARNLLDNSDFINPVNQRGATSYAAAGYTIDRWKMVNEGCNIQITESGIQLNNTGANTVYLLHMLPPETVIKLAGKKVTLAAMIDGAIYCFNSTFPTTAGGAENSTLVPFGGIRLFRYENNVAAFTFDIYSGKSGTIEWAALYEGEYTAESLPPYVPKGYGAELAECMRYYVHTTKRGYGFATSTTAYVTVPTPNTMRVKPSILNLSLGTLRCNGNSITPTAVTVSALNANGILLQITYASSSVANHACSWEGSCAFSADL